MNLGDVMLSAIRPSPEGKHCTPPGAVRYLETGGGVMVGRVRERGINLMCTAFQFSKMKMF